HAEIHRDETAETHGVESAQQLSPVGKPRRELVALEHSKGLLERRKALDLEKRQHIGLYPGIERAKLLGVALERIVALFLVFIHGSEHRSDARLVQAERTEIIEPHVAVAQPNIKIFMGQAEDGKALHQQGDELDLGLGARLPKNIGIHLEKRAAPALLHPLVAIKLGDAEPLDRALERAGLGADEATDGRRHLRTQGHLATALVRKAEKLPLDLIAGLGLVEFQRLKHRGIVFREAKGMGRAPPEVEDVLPTREVVGIKIAKTGKRLKRRH